MSFTVTAHERGAVIKLGDERLDLMTAPPLKNELKRLLENGVRRLTIDFSAVRFVDSSGLGVILSALRIAARTGSRIRVTGLCPEVVTIFELAQMHRVLDMDPSENDTKAG